MGLFFTFKGAHTFKLSEVLVYYKYLGDSRFICNSLVGQILEKKKWYQITFFAKITSKTFTPSVHRAFHNAYPEVFSEAFNGMYIHNWVRDPQMSLKMCEGDDITSRRLILMESLLEQYGDRELVIEVG